MEIELQTVYDLKSFLHK